MVDIYVEYMSTVATLLGTKCNTTEKMREIMDFEKKLAKVGVVTYKLWVGLVRLASIKFKKQTESRIE